MAVTRKRLLQIDTTGELAQFTVSKPVAICKTDKSIYVDFDGEFEKLNLKGDTGEQGERGEQGLQGLQGTQGERGENGIDGRNGINGANGINGIDGVTGAKGETGERGLTGLQGVKGDKGDKGDTGNTGLTGSQGIQGLTGAKGDTGEQGVQGLQGIAGTNGTNGTTPTNAQLLALFAANNYRKIYQAQITQAIPVLALGGVFSFPVTVTGATLGMVASFNTADNFIDSLSTYSARVTAANTVTITLKAGVALLAASKIFNVRVIE